ncbi:MAG TPA: cupin domain-containing protein [Pilimelia sp.]|nr:cupin domain-containing protein [Pilimelia sp.]
MSLARCVALPEDEFHSNYFGTRHLHTPAAKLPGFGDLFSAAAVEELLTGTGLRTSSVRLVRDGREVPAPAIAERGDPGADAGYVDTDRIRTAIATGSTLILRSLHRYHPPVRALAHALGGRLGAPVRVNAFVTPPNATGVDLHYDIQDVFVLQIAGTKLWHLRASPLARPLPSQAWFDRPAAQRIALTEGSRHLDDILLREGDSLYLPRGTMHAPRTRDDLSIHLTLAVSVLTRHDLLRGLLDAAGGDEWFREHVTLPQLEDDLHAAADLLTEVAARLVKTAAETAPGPLLWGLRREAFRDVPAAPTPVLPVPGGPAAQEYRLRDGAQFTVTPGSDGALLLHVPGKQVALPAQSAPVLDGLRRDGRVNLATLRSMVGDDTAATFAGLLISLDLVTAA